ncbi:helix-turn-helix domain-containing protein [Halostreptopolyspora alba]|uniref:XRE family transcriptional regulator n=1 Tax=Halostreptopolyspora alba TaxID=2487137 RepID=A0A3N0EIF3_9ACTN|nr:XRE family transcriptional regulator [Nocardiopsaceae bacterium YIM 96095]
MIDRQSPTVRRRRLARELRRLREAAGLSAAQATKELGWAAGRINHLESGRHGTDPSALRDLMRLYGVDAPDRVEAILALGRQARQRGWWHSYTDVLDGDYLGFEAEAAGVTTYQPAVVPGLLQTRDYAAASAKASGAVTEADIERVVAARMERQVLLSSDLEVNAVIDESSLLRLAHRPDIAGEQLAQLVSMAEEAARITIRMLPLSAGLHASMGSGFVILDYTDDLDKSLVYLEGRTGGTFLEKDEELDDYRKVYSSLVQSSLSQLETIKALKKLLKEV